ncbi:MAG: DUF3310 domain-containing protein [Verrucomicrobiota bacterium]
MHANNDQVNNPPHYTAHPSGIECIQVTEYFNFNLGNAIKYIWRSALKNSLAEDLKKARWYLSRELKRITGQDEADDIAKELAALKARNQHLELMFQAKREAEKTTPALN